VIIIAAVVVSTRRPVAIAETNADQAAIEPPAPTQPGGVVEDTVDAEREPLDIRRADPTNSTRH
jgi:hypothetical protein